VIDEVLRTFLLTLVTVPVQEGYVAQDQPPTRVWYGKSGATYETFLSGSPSLNTYDYDLEVHSIDIAIAQTTADTIRQGVNGGRLGGSNGVLGVLVNDASDDYQYRGLNSDDNYEVCGLRVRIFSTL
jgi:hypothetical protein